MIGVIADDITGANDIGVMFNNGGFISDVYSYDSNVLQELSSTMSDVLIFDTDSRLNKIEKAYEKVFQATKNIKQAGATQFFNKTCSVFRGNIGAEFDAMLDALNEEFAVIVLGFPKNGRKTIHGIHMVHDEKLENSQFKNDPVHPMTESNLVDILQKQTNRKVTLINIETIKQGAQSIRAKLDNLRKEAFHYVILDVEEQADLHIIAQAIYDQKIICGSSAIAEEIPKVQSKSSRLAQGDIQVPESDSSKGLFCAVGSLTPQTINQIRYARDKGIKTIELKTLGLISTIDREEMQEELAEMVIQTILSGDDVIVHSTNTPDLVHETKQQAKELGMDNTAVSKLVSNAIAFISEKVMKETKQYRFVIAGGDTSATVCQRLNIRGMRVWEEIQTGLPSCISLNKPSYLFILKSGSFGDETFLEKAFDHLRSQ
ncbi:four-carbon acid sugar kinase family protein [Gracilibacillus salitolerans]|uniref:Four-carbon acid sugar kinase family protein n=1 Tax=Gracilibacillus salitolerans TaxID=2663022 RepID=A0A5Q2TI69_9BACI|nr:four-carbon acid sugar kinase family protein [Gracilibacillus salitolerans]QGH33650.1 four-carbon acid sugar kinase family protein [Gracilibacillus salitolerans]